MAPRIPPEESALEIYRGDEVFIPNRDFTGYITDRPTSSSIDVPIDEASPNTVLYQFGTNPNDKVELHIYSMVDSLMESTYDTAYNRVAGILRPPRYTTLDLWGASDDMGVNSVKINLHSVFRDLGYISGRFKFQLNFHRNVLGTAGAPATLIGVSSDRLELTLLCSSSIQDILQAPKVDQYGNRTEFYANIGDNKLFRVANFQQDTAASNSKGNVYVLALQNPLPGEIGPGIPIWVDIQSADPQKDVIVIYPKKKKQTYHDLQGPNFNIETNEGLAQSTAFRSWDSLLGSNVTSSQQLINNLISSSFDLTELAIDYKDYSQFVFYSSAEDRLENFKYKLELLEYYDGLIDINNNIASPSIEVTNNINDLTVKRNAILSGFDGYEKYLYYESSSYETSSYGEFTPTTWPKSTSVRPYINFSVTSSEAQTWYAGQLESASLYDNGNRNALQYLIPEHIRETANNEPYTAFVNMMGQHFDILWSYVHHLTRIHTREDSLLKGLAKDLVYHVLRSLGIDSINGFRLEELWLQGLGLDDTGNYRQTGSLQSIPTGDISKETWKRILNNLPYLLKTKGTRRGIRALLNCYGVPSTVYRVKEYSGPYQYRSNTFDISAQHRKVEKYTLATHFSGPNTLAGDKFVLGNCNTVMFRFKPATGSSTAIGTNMSLNYIDGHNDKLNIGSATLTGPWYARDTFTGERRWTTVAQVNNTIYAFQSVDGRVLQYSAAGGPINSTFGGAGADVYVQEFKGWSSALDVEVLREIARNPQSILGSSTVETYSVPGWQSTNDYDYTTAYTELLFRYPLGTTLQRYTGSTMPSIHPDQTPPNNASIVGFTSASYVGNEENYYVWYPNLGEGVDLSEKIRLYPANASAELHRYYSIENENLDTYAFDSPKLGVFFSPQDEINEDIADQFSGLSMDDVLGDPRDDYEPTYRALEALRTHYNLKFTGDNSFWKYIKLIENFDASMFYLIKKFLPARAVKLVGLVIQPTLLERSKSYIKRPSFEREDLNVQLPGYYTTLDASPEQLNADPIVIKHDQESEYLTYLDNIENYNHTVLSGDVEELYTGVITVNNGALTSNVDIVNESANIPYAPAGKFNHTYGGCKMSSRGFNIPSSETPDGGPVVEFWTNNPNSPIHAPNQGGALQLAGGTGRNTGTVPSAIVGRVKTNVLEGKVITNYPVLGDVAKTTQTTGNTPGPLGGRAIVNYTGTTPLSDYVPEGKVITNRNQA